MSNDDQLGPDLLTGPIDSCLDGHLVSASSAITPQPSPDVTQEDGEPVDGHQLNVIPWKMGPIIAVTYVPGGRIMPLPHPGIWDDDE